MVRTDRLIIVAGPSCVGKTFLIDRLQRYSYLELQEQLDMGDCSSWQYVNVSELPQIGQEEIERLVVHYDFYTQYSKEIGFKYLPELLSKSKDVTVLTLTVPHDILCRRLSMRLAIRFVLRLCKLLIPKAKRRSYSKLRKKQSEYKKGNVIPELYEKWSQYLDTCNVTTSLLLDTRTPIIKNATPWNVESRG